MGPVLLEGRWGGLPGLAASQRSDEGPVVVDASPDIAPGVLGVTGGVVLKSSG